MSNKEPQKAAAAYSQALVYNSMSLVALQGLARAQQQPGDNVRSAKTLEQALHLAPLEPGT
jgi:hypothetical protein